MSSKAKPNKDEANLINSIKFSNIITNYLVYILFSITKHLATLSTTF